MPVEPQKPYISSKEAAKKYGLTNDHIGLLCRRGKIQGLLWGRVWYVSEPSLEDYVKKSLALKEARKKALSKQWHAAWTAAFLAFAVFSLNTTNASADYVTPSPRLKSAPTPAAVTIASVAESIGEFQKSVPLPQVPKLEPLPAKQNDGQFFTDMGSGLFAVGEGIAAIFYTKKSTASTEEVRVVYAADFVPDSDAPSKLVAPRPKKSLPEQLAAVSQTASAALATVPPMIPTLQPIKENSFFTAENLVAGTAAANEILDGVNTALFGAYAQGARDLARIALFDATQAGYTFDRIFGEFGRQYVHDLSAANELQVRAYLKAGEVVNNGYNSLADAIDRIPSLNSSISVASAGYGSPDLGAAAGDTVTSWWNGAVEYLSNIFVAIATDSNKLASNAPAQNPLQKSAITSDEPAQHSLTSQAPQPGIASANTSSFVAPSLAVNVPTYMVASVPAPAQANTTPQKSRSTLLGSSYSPELITQTQLNNQFDAWMLVVKNLIAGNTGYVNNPEVAALGGGGGGGTVNNYYSLSQRIDKLDGVTITNATITGSSVNGISDFSNLGGSTVSGSIGNWFAPLSYGNATSTTVGFNAGLLSVGSTTINGNATTTGNFDIGGGSSGSNKLVLNGINGSNVFNQEISQSISGQTSTLLFKLNHGSLPASNETNTVRFYGGNTSLEAVNENDSLGVKFVETFSTAFLGLTSTGGASGSVPSGGFLLSFALGNDGKVGSVSRTSYSSPNWRNVLDDGSGNFSVSGRAIVSGNVGIGTTSPYAKLSVAGDVVAARFVATTTATSTFAGAIQASCFSIDGSTCIDGSGGSAVNLYATTTIGDGTQAGGLTISGGATTTGGIVNIVGNNNVNSGANILTLVNKTSINGMVAGTQFYNDIGNNVGLRFRDSSGAAIRTNLGVTTNTYFANLVNVSVGVGTSTPWAKFSIANFTGDTPGQPLFAVASSTSNSTTTLFSISNTGAVQIGANGQALDIGTNTGGSPAYVSFQSQNATNRSFVGFSPNIFGVDSGATVLQAGAARGIALSVNNGTFGNNVAVAVYISPSGNVGIGTTTPATMLDVKGSAQLEGASATLTINPYGSVGDTNYINFANNRAYVGYTNGYTVLESGSGKDIRFVTNNSTFSTNNPAMVITGGNQAPVGYVGIGTTTPAALMHVWGGSASTDNILGVYQVPFSNANTAASIVLASQASSNYVTFTNGVTKLTGTRQSDGSNNFDLFLAPGSSQSIVSRLTVVGASGNVGIGTTSPWANLSVNSTAGTTQFVIGSSTATQFIVDKNGNVGIGKAAPIYSLDVAGDANVSANLRINDSFALSRNGTDLQINNTNSGINSKLLFYTNNSGSSFERARIDTNGNVGIGTTSPYAKLSVVGEAVVANVTATSTTATSTIAGGLNVGSGALTYDFSSGITSINNLAVGALSFDTDAGIVSWADLPISSNASAGTVESYTANVGGQSVFTIYGTADGAGNATNLGVGIGTTSPSSIGGTAAYLTLDKSATAQYSLLSFATTTSSVVQFAFANGNGVVGTISTNGSATAYNTSSDRRIKQDIASTTLGLSTLLELPVRDFSFLADPTHATTTGFIAQELFKVFPYAVTTNGDDGTGSLATGTLPWSVDYGRVTPLIVKAVQDIADITSTFKTNLISWLADAGNGITKLFAKEVHTDTLCVGSTCVTQEQFLAMVQAAGQHASAPAPQAPVIETPDTTSTATSTPDVPDAPAEESASSTPEAITDASSTPPAPVAPQATSTPEVTLNEAAILESIGASSTQTQ